MDNLRKTIDILFRKCSPEKQMKEALNKLSKNVRAELDEKDFNSIFLYENPFYSHNEIDNVISISKNRWFQIEDRQKEKSIFNILVNFGKKVLTEKNGEPECEYEMLLRWRETSFLLGEDLFTTSFLAQKDIISGETREVFSWRPVISTNNVRIKEILRKGLAENHFHLYGSAPHFDISWIELMNAKLSGENWFSTLKSEKRLLPELSHDFSGDSHDFYLLIKKAAVIRAFFFSKLMGEKVIINCKNESDKRDVKYEELLSAENGLEFDCLSGEFNNEVKWLQYEYGKSFSGVCLDYAIPKRIAENNYITGLGKENENGVLYGERSFLYSMFKKIFEGETEYTKYEKLFYAYLLIKSKLRGEFIQINNRVGFENFRRYQDRKGYFTDRLVQYEKAVLKLAVNRSMADQNIEKFELRIAPKRTAEEIDARIKEIDKNIIGKTFVATNIYDRVNMEKELKHFYVLHFIKRPEKENYKKEKGKMVIEITPRNNCVREEVKESACAIYNLKKGAYYASDRVLGIDAANIEIGCRPEVFAQAFRYLKDLTGDYKNKFLHSKKRSSLGFTFHAGEDFYDIVDGLRTIDEAVRFLNLSHGDRLGHAIALGTDVREFYDFKSKRLILPLHDLLDNIVWMISRIRKHNIGMSSLVDKLQKDYSNFFSRIYKDAYIWEIDISLNKYYDAWKLRGDNPFLYLNKSYEEGKTSGNTEWERFAFNKRERNDNLEFIRKDNSVRKLYELYHFSPTVKEIGEEIEEYAVTDEYIEAVYLIQKALQKEVGSLNLGIETNPSSNVLISTFKKYAKHPILNMYNLGLTYDSEKLKEVPQLFVSINTDDQGVFGTYLENEYALMALALEKEKDEKGNKIYNQAMIYDWLERIRRMGMEQSFRTF